jgi:hypothetical protein
MRALVQLFLIPLLYLSACNSREDATLSFLNDYEQASGWTDAELEKGVAHSGLFSQKITPSREYSHGFTLPVSQLAPGPEGIIAAEVWVTALSLTAPVQFVIDIVAPGSNKHFKTVYKDLQPVLDNQKGWKKVTASVSLKGLPTGEPYFVKVYIWNNQQQQLWMDDLSVNYIKH